MAYPTIVLSDTDRAALEAVWGGSFDSFYEAWNQWAGALPPPAEGVEVLGPVLREDAGAAVELVAAAYYSARTEQPAALPIGSDHPYYAGWQP